jgi:ectoine hydroxylase-related dioxygenase (phytanoyl-CoA dioxygenase family)
MPHRNWLISLKQKKNFFVLLVRTPGNFVFSVRDVIAFKFFNRRTSGAVKRFQELFYVFGGSILDSYSKFISKKSEKFPVEGLLEKFTRSEIDEKAEFLKENGYVVFENVLSSEFCDRFLDISLQTPGTFRVMDDGKPTSELGYFNRTKPQAIRFDYDTNDMIKIPEVQELFLDYSLVDFAQQYLGAAPILDIVTMWWHTSYSSTPDKHAAQWFHFDLDTLKWIKFFFYVTDVDVDSGPHVFVPKSHSRSSIPSRLRRKGYTRLADEEVAEVWPPSSWMEFVGKRGTLIVEDTRGLHKGKHVIKGDRLLFQIQFSSTSYGDDRTLSAIKPNEISQKNLATIRENAYVYQNIKIVE